MGKNTVFFGGKSVNRVDPIDTNLSYRGRTKLGGFEVIFEEKNGGQYMTDQLKLSSIVESG